MSENKTTAQSGLKLDDGRRVKVLSPGMMVFKRFIRNRLAIAGICILVFMFLFSFIGGLLSPYRQDQVFYKYDLANKEYAGAVLNTEYRFSFADGVQLSAQAKGAFNLAAKNGKDSFSANGENYSVTKAGDDFYLIGQQGHLASIAALGKITKVTPDEGVTLSPELEKAATDAVTAKQSSFELDGVTYTLNKGMAKSYDLYGGTTVAMASVLSYDAYSNDAAATIGTFAFRMAAETALRGGQTSFELDGVTYTMNVEDSTSATILKDGEPVANVSNMIVSPVSSDVFLPISYKAAVTDAIHDKKDAFTYLNETTGEEEKHSIAMRQNNYVISKLTNTMLIDMYAPPSGEHLLGTDGHGMDTLTRLMYGGRISLLVGFVVVILEMLIGIIIGGVSGFFGGWVDTLLMRFVDLFNSIPYYPMMIIAGSIMDAFEVNPYTRIFLLMGIMGIMGWTGVARVVRGQILSLREQDFMVAAEATGIKVSRRIFRHLVPNVMPLLIVNATMGLGGIILTEATLSFLGLGIKYPLASWGTIINAASDIYVMTNYWYIWIPAGLLIVLTVLGFNFVGDGLRDAFDPKMKR